ncbi:DUF4811 domain-containing protein [Convivina praedatoris]|uniref:DUF4811 domain-containing protein n=1 Tax=Convivina praedatoris TaxID=2880963 RepID=A0ABN8HBZ9_9LACO|nr:DUF4811 domain-containing protein [Convivina sp. LMG 32447]CAH1851505.1 hypothetical protein LMG032447_00332 [Convivina sp. LMG 32447]CAH1851525.1 hypothetical protein R078138_00342 [Convivina sp. LMG 32447]CAH1853219.1 hypothetical protein R077815_00775 [Convivina sp. LMG 32447]
MILLILFLFVALAFISLMFLDKQTYVIGGVIGFIGIILSVGLITANMANHFGMETKVTTHKSMMYSATNSKGYGVLLYQPVGTSGKENVYIYRKHEQDQKPTIVKPDLTMTTNRQEIAGNQAYRVIKDTRYVYKNDFWKLMFSIAGNDGELKKRQVTYQLPQNWIALTTQQAKNLQAKMTPKTDEEKAAVAQQQEALAELAQNDPDQAGIKQVQQIKATLNI